MATTDPLRSTSYPVTPTLSVDAVHDRLVEVAVVPDAVRYAGVVGAVVSDGTVVFELATERAGTASVTPLEKVTVIADPLMFAAW